MANEMPKAMSGTDRGNPAMTDNAGSSAMIRQLASKGGQGGQGNPEQQSAEMVMQGAQMLMQAAQLNPQLVPIVQRAVETLRMGVQAMAQGQGGVPKPPKGAGKKSKQPKSSPDEEGGVGAEGGMGY